MKHSIVFEISHKEQLTSSLKPFPDPDQSLNLTINNILRLQTNEYVYQ